MKYCLEKVNNNDKQEIYTIKKNSIMYYVRKIWGWDEKYQVEDFENSFNPINFKKITINQKCVGFIETHEDNNVVNITEIHLITEYQGLGIGSDIIKQVIVDAKEISKTVTLGCFKENKGAINLYKRIGFKIVNKTETHICFEI
ncbi:GNAT family N-acetyltransferase [Sedimentibacter sp. zth1]|uniref:GNAT family N-acetyltransferase n=1 Tax=Sedimentibacter sp. zth1 TaxID=2816908 RepID=UPI001A917163|nr:GNAT family N-acetyltransferase [Sedimentibacter sp. zth1]QSX06578.1 GNAT family N-acetyltransferase [Sedimentibacter sp. zth1]